MTDYHILMNPQVHARRAALRYVQQLLGFQTAHVTGAWSAAETAATWWIECRCELPSVRAWLLLVMDGEVVQCLEIVPPSGTGKEAMSLGMK